MRSTVTGPDARVARLKVSDSRCKRTTTRIIVARRAPVLRGAIELSRALLRPSLRSVWRSAVGPGGRRARQDCGWNAAGIEPAVASGVHCVALRSRQSRAPARLYHSTNAAVAALGAARRVGESRSRWSACGFGRCAPCGSRSEWPGAREKPRASASITQPRGQQPLRLAKTSARTPGLRSTAVNAVPLRPADRSGPALLSAKRRRLDQADAAEATPGGAGSGDGRGVAGREE